MPEVLILKGSDVASAMPFGACVDAVAEAFMAHTRGDGRAFPVVREQLPGSGIFGVKSGYLAQTQVIGLKAGGFWSENPKRGLPAHQSAALVFDADTGQLSAVMDANVITILRTAAAGALAAKHLAPAGARTLAVVGSGVQATAQTRAAVWAVPSIDTVWIHARSDTSYSRFERSVADLDLTLLRAASIRESVRAADVVVTTTPSWKPLIEGTWLQERVHVSAIGTDTKGKQELDPDILRGAMLVVDDWDQARTIGECQHGHREGWLQYDAVHAELGELIMGAKAGRTEATTRSVFDSTGLALQDLATASAAVHTARRHGLGHRINLADVAPEDVWSS